MAGFRKCVPALNRTDPYAMPAAVCDVVCKTDAALYHCLANQCVLTDAHAGVSKDECLRVCVK